MLGALAIAACSGGDTPATASAVISNSFPAGAFTLLQVVYHGTTWSTPIPPGGRAPAVDVAPGHEYAYALAVYGATDAGVASPPLVLRLRNRFETVAGGTFTIDWSFPSHYGKCGGMTEAEYDQIHATVFPGTPVQSYASIVCP
jgi:hypothetical protein